MHSMTEPLLLTTAQVSTFDGTRLLTRASGFFFARDERLFLVTSRHVVIDKPSKHDNQGHYHSRDVAAEMAGY